MAILSGRPTLLIALSAVLLTLTLSYLTLNLNLTLLKSSPSPSTPVSPESCRGSFVDEPNITYYKDNTTLAPAPLPKSHTATDAATIIPTLLSLSRTLTFRPVANITLNHDTFEPEGLLLLPPNRLLLSTAEYTEPTRPFPGGELINGTDRTPGAGFSHLQVYSFPEGEILADATVSREGAWEYHNGGIDWDGEFVWGVLGQRRRASSGSVYRVDPRTMEGQSVVSFEEDHLGTVIRDGDGERVVGLSWGSRKGYVFDTSHAKGAEGVSCVVQEPEGVDNPSHFIDYQDCKYMGVHERQKLALCSGVSKLSQHREGEDEEYTLGGLALVDVETLRPVWEMPVELGSERGTRITMNPFDVTVEGGRVRFWWAPDQHETVVYGFEVEP